MSLLIVYGFCGEPLAVANDKKAKKLLCKSLKALRLRRQKKRAKKGQCEKI